MVVRKYFSPDSFCIFFHATELTIQFSINCKHRDYEALLLCQILILICNNAQCNRWLFFPSPFHEDNSFLAPPCCLPLHVVPHGEGVKIQSKSIFIKHMNEYRSGNHGFPNLLSVLLRANRVFWQILHVKKIQIQISSVGT